MPTGDGRIYGPEETPPAPPINLKEEQQAAMYRSLMTRNVKAFLAAKGERAELEKTPEYMTEGAKLLKKVFGVDLAAYMCRQDETKRFNRWCRGNDLPRQYEAIGLLAAIEVVEILLGKLSPAQAREWMLAPCGYILDNLPMDFIRADAELVRRAALQNFL